MNNDLSATNENIIIRKPKKKEKWSKVLLIILAVLIVVAVAAVFIVANPRGGKPWIDSDLKMNIRKNAKLDPKDDFHLYVNYDWLKSAEIKEGYTVANSFTEVMEEMDEKALALFSDDSLKDHDAELIKAYYTASLDWDSRNALGVEPIRATVEDIQGISNIDELTAFICDFDRSGDVPIIVNYVNSPSFSDSSKYVLNCREDRFLLSDAAEYSHKTISGRIMERAYRRLSVGMLKRFGYSKKDANSIFDDAISLEAKLAEVCMSAAEQNRPEYLSKINNEFTMEEADQLAGNYPLADVLEAAGYGDAKTLLIYEPAYIERLGEIYTNDNLPGIKACMMLKYVFSHTMVLDRQSFDLNLSIGRTLSGSSGQLSDEEYAYQDVLAVLRDPLENCYLGKYDATAAKARVEELCYKIISYYRQMLNEINWLSQKTINKAIGKLDSITVNVAYPEKRLDYSKLNLAGLSLFECDKTLKQFQLEIDRSRTNQPVETGYWPISTLQTNAFYSPQENSINILLGILGGNFYRDDMSVEELYAGIGTVIGHEISHAFDTNGAQFDKNGDIKNWWSEKDHKAFQERAQKLVAYYDKITPFGILNINGTSVQTEAIADIAGLKCMLALAKDTADFDYDKFFRHYAENWRSINTIQIELMYSLYEVHPLSYLRTNVTVQQFQEFHDTYNVQPGNKMYLATKDRISVW